MKILNIGNFSWFSSSHKRADNSARYYSTDRKISNGLMLYATVLPTAP